MELLAGVRSLEILIQKVQDRLVASNLISLLGEAVTLVVENYVFDYAALLLHRFDYLVGLGFDNSRIVLALQHNQRPDDLIGVKERGNRLQIFEIGFWIADLLIERFAE